MTHLVISAGDPNGIGLEVLLKALKRLSSNQPDTIRITLVVHPQTLVEYASYLGWRVVVEGTSWEFDGRRYGIIPCSTQAAVRFGEVQPDAGAMTQEALEIAVQEALQGRADAVVTMPVAKHTLQKVGFPFPGQTEFFAARSGVECPLMILATATPTAQKPLHTLRVGLATIHVPLSAVPSLITRERVVERLHALHQSLRNDFGFAHVTHVTHAAEKPRIAVLGLNPHAGEEGMIGTEDRDVLAPAIAQACSEGIAAEGPFPADGFFAHGAYKRYDAVLAMYHDQGLIPLKLIAGGAGVNISAGLPIVRTSPDHGTGYAIAGKNIADESSVVEALQMALQIVKSRRAAS